MFIAVGWSKLTSRIGSWVHLKMESSPCMSVFKCGRSSVSQSTVSPLWLNSSVSSVSAEVITAEDSVGSWLSSLAMAVTLRRSAVLSHGAVDRLGRSLGNDTVSSTWVHKYKMFRRS